MRYKSSQYIYFYCFSLLLFAVIIFCLLFLILLDANLKGPVRKKRTTIESSDGIVGFFHGGHVNEAEALAGTVGVTHDTGASDITIDAEEFLKTTLVHGGRDVVDEDADALIRHRSRDEGRKDARLLVIATTIHVAEATIVVATTIAVAVVLGVLHAERGGARDGLNSDATKGLHGLTSSRLGIELDETVALTHVGVTVDRNVALNHGTKARENSLEIVLLSVGKKIANVQVDLHLRGLGNSNMEWLVRIAALKRLAIESINSGLSALSRTELDKTVATRHLGHTISHNICVFNSTIRREDFLKLGTIDIQRKIVHNKLGRIERFINTRFDGSHLILFTNCAISDLKETI